MPTLNAPRDISCKVSLTPTSLCNQAVGYSRKCIVLYGSMWTLRGRPLIPTPYCHCSTKSLAQPLSPPSFTENLAFEMCPVHPTSLAVPLLCAVLALQGLATASTNEEALPATCNHSTIHLPAGSYQASGQLYDSCTIVGEPGSIITGHVKDWSTLQLNGTLRFTSSGAKGDCFDAGSTPCLDAYNVRINGADVQMDKCSICANGGVHIKGANVQMHESRISIGTGVVVIDGGKINFVGGGMTGNLESGFEISNGAKATFSNTNLYHATLLINKSDASFTSTPVYSFSHQNFVVSDSNLSMVNSTFTSGRASFFAHRSTLSLTRSAIHASAYFPMFPGTGTAMKLTNSKVQASCPGPLDDMGSAMTVFSGAGNFHIVYPGMTIYETDVVFTNCSCQIGKSMWFTGPMEINRSSVRYEQEQDVSGPCGIGAPATTLV
jgi:hypothetical protein